MIYQQAINFVFSDFNHICPPKSANECLSNLANKVYKNTFIGRELPCELSCESCTRWGTCNSCENILCETCESFDEICTPDSNFNPCLPGFVLSNDKKFCCHSQCTGCIGPFVYLCTSCADGFKLNINLCTLQCPTGYSFNQTHCFVPSGSKVLSTRLDVIANVFNDLFQNTFYVGNGRKFYPERDENDPIPAKSRGFYFLGKSVLRTSEFKIPHWASLEFWVRQDARGILIRKGEIVIDSNVSHNYSGNYVNTGISLKNETWMSLVISTFVYLDMYIIKTKLNGATEHVYSSTNFIDDKNSPIFLGDAFNGFKGFISLFLISGNIELPVSSISVCASIDNSACLWNCSINSFWTASGCVPCKPNCNEGCVSSKNCNKCAMNLCYNCSNFVSGCISCLQNAEQVLNCSCKPGYFETTDSDQCLSCSFGCSKCKLTTSCIECFSGFTLSNGNCLCSEGFYTTSAGCLPCHSFCKSCFGGLSNECTTCKTSFMLMNNNECKCEQNSAYNMNTNLCESCQEKCEICSIPSFCTQCKSGYQLDINGHCSCQLGTYLENNECKPCNSLCKSCWGPNEAQCESCAIGYFRISQKCECKKPQSYSLCLKCDTSLNLKQQDNLCLCQEGFYPKYTCKDCIEPCECENQISWIDECLKCDTSCLTCSDFNYFHCESCEKFFLNHLCFDVCPLGYKIDGTQCKVNETVALFLLFDLNLPSSNSVLFCSDQKNSPFPIMNRGIFFPESSNCLKYKITERPALAPSFFISTWFKVSGNFQVFQVKCSELFIISFKYLKKLVFTFKVNGRQNDIQSELQVKEELWNYFLISVKFQQFSEVSMKINRDYEEVLPGFEGAFKDPGFGFISFGENFEGLLGSGLIYLFRILTKSARIEDFYLLDLPECKNLSIAEKFCISECGPFEVNLNFTCKPCKAECLFGCINLTSCWQCDDPSCMTCNPLIPSKCFKCKKKFEMQGKSCVRCKISEFYDEVSLKCLPCPELCFNCESKTFCTSCIENSQIQSNKSCSCKSGYKKSSNSCIQVTFKVVSTVSKSNEITLYFTESLNNSINSESILVTLGDSKVDFKLKEKDKKTYILLLQIPRSSKSFPKNLKITFFQTIYSINSSLLETSVIELNLYDVEEIKNHETSEENKGQISALTAASLAFLACVFLMNPQSFFNFLNLIEMYSYVLLYDIEIHQDFIDFLNGLKSSTKFPSVNLMKIKGERNVSRKFEIYGITSSYILDNFGVQIFLLLSMIVLVLSSLIISLSKIRFIKNLSSKILNSLCFNWFIQFFNVQCFDLAVFCLLSLFNFNQDVWLEIFDYTISAVLMAGLASLLVLQLLIIVKYPLNNPDFQVNTKFSVLFERFQITNWSKFLFNTIFLSRRLFIAFLIHFSYGIFQLLSSIIFTFMNLFYVSFNNPFKELKDCVFQIFNEGILLSFFAVLLINRLEIYQFSSFVEAEICIRIVLAALGFNVFFNFYEIVQKVVLWVKSRIGSGKVTHLGNEETGNTFAGIKAAKNR